MHKRVNVMLPKETIRRNRRRIIVETVKGSSTSVTALRSGGLSKTVAKSARYETWPWPGSS
jgi:hypothetical protein